MMTARPPRTDRPLAVDGVIGRNTWPRLARGLPEFPGMSVA
jgi:hypothetical protein